MIRKQVHIKMLSVIRSKNDDRVRGARYAEN